MNLDEYIKKRLEAMGAVPITWIKEVTYIPTALGGHDDMKRSIEIEFEIDKEFVKEKSWNSTKIIGSEPEYRCTGIVPHKYRMKTYSPKLKRLMR